MNKKTIALITLAGLLAASTLFAAQVQLVDGFGPWQTGSGGEFTFHPIGWDPTPNYALGLSANIDGNLLPNFQTFCVEGNEHIDANELNDVTFNNQSVYTGFPLTQGAAYLYSQFARGVLPGYDYFNTGVGRHTTAGQLQNAIWALMGGQVGQVPDLSNPFEFYVSNIFGSFANANLPAGANNYGVEVLNLWTPGLDGTQQGARQDMLVLVPDGGTTVMLLGMGLSGIAIIGRRIRR